jgi:thiamine kinase-like enzyme
MILANSNVIHYLIALNSSKSKEDLVEFRDKFLFEKYQIYQTKSPKVEFKNRSFNVVSKNKNAQSFFLKQPKNFDYLNKNQLEREDAFYNLIEDEEGLKHIIPKFFDYNEKLSISVFRYVENPGTVDILEGENYALLENLGKSLSFVHTACKQFLTSDKVKIFQKLYPSKVFFMADNNASNLNKENLERLNLNDLNYFLMEHPEYRKIINDAQALWLSDSASKTIIHGDLKLNNVIIDSDKNVWIIDWENVLIGNPEWDYATLLFSIFLTENMNNIPESIFIVEQKIKAFEKGYGENLEREKIEVYFLILAIEYLLPKGYLIQNADSKTEFLLTQLNRKLSNYEFFIR